MKIKPFVVNLPLESDEYYEILTDSNAVKMRSGLVTLAPGESVGVHSTEDFEELIIVLKGSGEVETVGEDRVRIARGQAAYNPPHSEHNVHNTGMEPMKYIYIVSKAE